MTNSRTPTCKGSFIFVAVALVMIGSPAAKAATVLQVDFDSLTPGAVTAATLDGVTTGGTWVLNSAGNATHSIEDDNSVNDDYAFLSTAVTANQFGAQVVLDSPVDIDALTGDLEIDFETATLNSTGFTRNARWRLYDGGTQLAEILMDDGTVFLNGANLGSLTGASDPNRVSPWDSTSAQVFTVDITVDNTGNLDLIMSRTGNSVSGSTTISSTANFDRIETRWDGIGGPMGVYLNDIDISTADAPSASSTPEPSSILLGAIGLFLLAVTRHRRKRS